MTATVRTEQLRIDPMAWPAELETPADASALVLLVDDSVGNRLGARQRTVIGLLHEHRLATLLMHRPGDAAEADDARLGLRVERLGRQVEQVVDWVAQCAGPAGLRLGLFGAGTGAAAALMAAAQRPGRVLAIVCAGGALNLAQRCLERVEAPTLLIVGAADRDALGRHRAAMRLLRCPRRLEAVPAATQRFEEPGALESVAEVSATWFDHHLARGNYA